MNRVEFIKELERRLKYIPAEDRIDAMDYYNEYLGEMNISDSDDISSMIESPKEIAAKIIADCTEKHINEQSEKKTVKNSATVVWLTILGLLSLPLSLPLLIVAATFVFAVFVILAAIVFSIFAIGFGFAIAGVCLICTAIFAGSIGQILVVFGMGLIGIAIALVAVLTGIGLIKLIAYICSLIFGKKKGKRNE